MHASRVIRAVATVLCAVSFVQADAATFDVTSGQTLTAAQTLAAGQTGTVESGGTLSINKGTVAITVTGNATIDNSGTITQTGTGRAIRDNTGGLTLNVTNNVGALMQSADADVIQMNVGTSNVTFTNAGTLNSLNASAGGSQAIDFNAITSGSNILNNAASGVIQASEADAVRPGVNGLVNNDGLIKCTTTTGSSSDGVDLQTNSGISIVNATTGTDSVAGTGTIEGARHGITGGASTTDTSATGGSFIASVINNLGGTIQGDDGSGINIDGFNKNEVIAIVNHGLISGNGVSADGDGVDVDGLVNLTNTGTIISTKALNDTSEGVTVGGGTILNSGTIEGDNINGGIGRGITLAGIDKDPLTDAPIVPPQAIYADTSVTNSGLIRGQSDSGIAVTGAASSFLISITNQAGGTIRGGGATAAAIATGANNASVVNSGAIIADASGKAIDFGSGNDALQIDGGSASIQGDISGGSGTSTLTIDPGAGNSFSYAGALSNFASVEIDSGNVILSGTNTYTGPTNVKGGSLQVDGTLASGTTVSGIAALHGQGSVSGSVDIQGAIQPGDVAGDIATLHVGALAFDGGSIATFDLGAAGSSDAIQSSASVTINEGANLVIHFAQTPSPGDYILINAGSISGAFAGPTFSPALPSNLAASVLYGGAKATLRIQAASGVSLSSSANPSVFGQSVVFAATVTGSAPSGAVTFFDGAVQLGSVNLSSGVAALTSAGLSVGSHAISASYAGDGDNTSAASSLASAQQVNAAATTTSLSALSSATFEQPVTITAHVNVVAPGTGTPGGTITINDGGSSAGDTCSIILPTTSCVLTPSSAGSKVLTGSYSGDGNFAASSDSTALGVGTVASTLTVTSSQNPSPANQAVTITATVTAGATTTTQGKALAAAPTGTLSFNSDGGAATRLPLVAASASYVTPAFGPGNHTIVVNYSGDANTSPSTFSFVQTVNAAAAASSPAAAPSLSLPMLLLLALILVAGAMFSLGAASTQRK